MPTSAPPHVARDLARLVESEALGEAFFGTAAHLGGQEQERRSWRRCVTSKFRPTPASAASSNGQTSIATQRTGLPRQQGFPARPDYG